METVFARTGKNLTRRGKGRKFITVAKGESTTTDKGETGMNLQLDKSENAELAP